MSENTKETSPARELKHGHTVVGTVAVPLTPLSLSCNRGVLVRAAGAGDPVSNTDLVWVGRKAVTAGSNVGTGGVPILPGASIVLPVDDPSLVYVVSLSEGQDVSWLGI